VNVIAADSRADAELQFQQAKRTRVRALIRPGLRLSDDDVDAFLASPDAAQISRMVQYSAVGPIGEVRDYLEQFAKQADADELMITLPSPTPEARLRSAELVAEEMIS
jgi:alkanesulfonate monooxygenase SsuD/methylene tetrahydromethanopterin reductase-like flavin-dependent oxidoreductase (luciferase family)